MENVKLHNLPETRLLEILTRCADLKIGVIGDLALDAYWQVDMTRAILSRETPHFPRPVVSEIYACGAGANVAENVKALGVEHVIVFSVLGSDWRGSLLLKEMKERDIDCSEIIVSYNRNTTSYIKPILMGYESQQEDARLDFVNEFILPEKLEVEVVNAVKRNIPSLDGLIIADQLEINGIITANVRKELSKLALTHPDKVFAVDSRQRINAFVNITLKPNKQEAIHAVECDYDPRNASIEDFRQVAEMLSYQANRPVFLTLGRDGILVYANEHTWHCPAAPTHPPLDPVGAGDTCIAAIAVSLAAGAKVWEAGVIANLAAAVTVEKLNQTGTASPEEIISRYELGVKSKVE